MCWVFANFPTQVSECDHNIYGLHLFSTSANTKCTPLQILWINLIMDGPPAQSLGVEPVDHDIMKQPPRKSDEPIITPALALRVLMASSVVCTGTIAVFFSEYDVGADEAAIRHDTTMTFTTFVMFAMFFAWSCRSVTKSVFVLGVSGNPMFVLAVCGCVICQVAAIYFPTLQAVFHTVPLSFADWARVLGVSSTVLVADELRKLVGGCLMQRVQVGLQLSNLGRASDDSSGKPRYFETPSLSFSVLNPTDEASSGRGTVSRTGGVFQRSGAAVMSVTSSGLTATLDGVSNRVFRGAPGGIVRKVGRG
jgi:hypothetical protein